MIKSTDLDNIANSFMQQVLTIKQKAYTKQRESEEQAELFLIANDIWAVASRLWPLSAQLRIEEQHDGVYIERRKPFEGYYVVRLVIKDSRINQQVVQHVKKYSW